jgi:hypothetical protein
LERLQEILNYFDIDINTVEFETSIFLFCIRRKNLQILQFLVEKAGLVIDDYGIFEAIRVGSIEIVKYLIENGYSSVHLIENKHWNTPLLFALKKRHDLVTGNKKKYDEIIDYLLKKNSSLTFRNKKGLNARNFFL